MTTSVGLERDKRGGLCVTFTCSRCGAKQSRPLQRARPLDIVYCVCGATAALTPRAFALLRDQAERTNADHAGFHLSI